MQMIISLTPGAILLKYNQTFGHGLRVAYYRDVVRPRILKTPPVTNLSDTTSEIHILTSSADWLNLVWVLKSYYAQDVPRFQLCIHEDGSLDRSTQDILRYHFPEARIISRDEADVVLADRLAPYPLSKNFRNTNPLALKVFDFSAFLECDRMFLLDSDVLFFLRPVELISRLKNPGYKLNTLNRDWQYGYSINVEETGELLDFEVPSLINSGLGLIHRDSIRFDLVEEFLQLPGILSHHHRIEQTLIALCSARYGFEFLPEEYDVHLGPFNSDHPCRHFTGPIRHRMYSEGIPRLIRQGILKN